MSADGDGGDGGPGEREVAHRLFAAEFEDASLEYSESDEDRAPNYVVTPTGARVNRLFVAGVLTEVETVNENTLRGRVVDPTGAFVTYAGQYQPDEVAFLDRTSPPAFVSLTGKARTFQPDDSDVVYTSVRPERLSEVTADTRDDWVVDAAEATLRRVAVVAAARRMEERGDALYDRLVAAGVDEGLATGVPLALDHYDTTETYLEGVRSVAREALAVVADERQEVSATTPAPDADDGTALGPLPEGFGLTHDESHTPATDAGESTATTEPTATAEATETTDTTAETERAETTATAEQPADDTVDAGTDDTHTTTESTAAAGAESTTPSDATVTETEASQTTTDTGTGAAGVDDAATVPDDSGTDDDLGGFDDSGVGNSEPTDDDLGGFDDSGTDDDLGGFDDSGTDDDLGGFDDGGVGNSEPTDDDLGEFDDETPTDPEEFDEDDLDDALTDEEREEVLSEHDVGFSSGTEVPDPEESELDAPDPEEITPSEPAGDTDPTAAESTGAGSASSGGPTEAGAEPTPDAGDETDTTDDAEDVDLESAVVDIMDELDDGDGADRQEVMALAVDRHGVTPGAAEEAIQGALMSGQCYEAGAGLKSI